MIKRWLQFLGGLELIALGVAFSIKADLGTSPISSLPYAASELWPVSVGVATVIMHAGFIAIQIAILRRRFDWWQLSQLPIGILFGVMIDGSLWLVQGVVANSYLMRWLYCALGIVLVGVGVWLEVLPRLLFLAGEGVISALSQVLPIRFGYLKVAFDMTLVASAAALSLAGLGHIVGVREGTLAAMLCVGLIVRALNKVFVETK